VVEGRAAFRCIPAHRTAATAMSCRHGAEITVGIGPHDIQRDDLVCVLFGCSVPVVVRPKLHYASYSNPSVRGAPIYATLIGPCYVHNYMEGEPFAGCTQTEVDCLGTEIKVWYLLSRVL
jgi:hypothetical protein